MKKTCAVALLILTGSAVCAAKGRTPQIYLWLFTAPAESHGGFVDPTELKAAKDRADSLKRLIPWLKGKDEIVIADAADHADIRIEVTAYGKFETGNTTSLTIIGGFTSNTKDSRYEFHAHLVAGDYALDIVGVPGINTSSEYSAAHQIREWIKANRDAIVKQRSD